MNRPRPAGPVAVVGATPMATTSVAVARSATGTAARRPIRTRNDAPLYRDDAVRASNVGHVAVAAGAGWGRRWGSRATSMCGLTGRPRHPAVRDGHHTRPLRVVARGQWSYAGVTLPWCAHAPGRPPRDRARPRARA